jgi:RNA polymerase sigma-70 factor (ECF subfamily)
VLRDRGRVWSEPRRDKRVLSMNDADAAVTRLWSELSASLRGWFERRTGDAHAAEDLLQECFLRVHDRIGDVREGERLGAWIQSIARNLLVDWRRRPEAPSVGAGACASSALEELADERTTGEDHDVDAIVAGWLAPTIAQLSPADRETLRLTELDGLTQRAAAERLGISLPALKSRVLRGRARLRERVLACCELEFDRRGGIVAYRERGADGCDC